ncbi:hypothetical protein BESB_054610 [Besnoitia besnoiti]|uniref:RanBP2-type domain-containing protein n=1 Tax=Besnoitia besnoiti TaxID=94643 RepID=A0A2A9MK62_BESBE|nr:hypothetical protein BESB_054610 [Besnoitia besnoiti]PFH35810.1 hypothetical protein BESB_054610 [Besnoitia besnoiti]
MESIVCEVAQKTVLTIVDEFISLGEDSPLDRTAEILQIALLSCEAKRAAAKGFSSARVLSGSSKGGGVIVNGRVLEDGRTTTADVGSICASRSSSGGQTSGGTRRGQSGPVLGGGLHFAAPRVLVPPENLKNPSSFLKIYGDPLCFAGSRGLVAGCRGNWKCTKCGTVNFPRRFRCKQCDAERDEEGHRIVLEYAKSVYQQYLAEGFWPVNRGDNDAPPAMTLYASPRACRRLKNTAGGEPHRWRWRRRGAGGACSKSQNGGSGSAAAGTPARTSRSDQDNSNCRDEEIILAPRDGGGNRLESRRDVHVGGEGERMLARGDSIQSQRR